MTKMFITFGLCDNQSKIIIIIIVDANEIWVNCFRLGDYLETKIYREKIKTIKQTVRFHSVIPMM